MKVLFPLFGLCLGVGVGLGTALAVRAPETAGDAVPERETIASEELAQPYELVTLDDQFVVPLVVNDQVSAMVILSLGLEVTPGTTATVFARQAKLRDVFLRALFQHANADGFGTDFTALRHLDRLRKALFDAAYAEIGEDVKGILILSLARQNI